MKKLTLAFAVCLLSAGAMAQKTGTKKAPPPPPLPPVVEVAVAPPPPPPPSKTGIPATPPPPPPPPKVSRVKYKKAKKTNVKFTPPAIVEEQQIKQ